MPRKPKAPPKQRIALGSPAFDKIMVENGGAQIVYPTQPFKHGYKVYWLDSKPPNFGRRLLLSDNEISLIKKFMDGKWDLQRFEKEDLQRLKARLVQKCNIQNPNDLTWDDILAHIGEHVQADLANIKPTESVGNATPATIINIDKIDKLGVLGNVQAEIVQTGDYSSIHKQMITGEKKKGIIRRILKIIVKVIGAIAIGIIAAIVIDILGDFGWLQSIKELIYN